MSKRIYLKKLVFSALFLSLAYVLPYLTGSIPKIGNMLCPMHFPILLCGFICGWRWGLAVGMIAPVLRSLTVGMPVFFPMAVSMSVELAVYGCLCGLLYRLLPKKIYFIYASLITSMAVGRIFWGITRLILSGITHKDFPFSVFIAGAVTDALPGILLQILIIPPIVFLP